jgi:hypothetical protein
VHVKFDGDEKRNRTVELDRFIDSKRGIVRSLTGQIVLDYRRGVCTVDAPKFQGCTGFLRQAGGRFTLSDVEILSEDNYVTVMVVPMDDRPLSESKRILLQVGTTARLAGWIERDSIFEADNQKVQGKEIVDTGRPPWRLAQSHLTLRIRNPHLQQAVILDPNGYPQKTVQGERQGQYLVIQPPGDVMYAILTP